MNDKNHIYKEVQIDDGEVSERRNLGGEQVAGRDDVECSCIAKCFIFTES